MPMARKPHNWFSNKRLLLKLLLLMALALALGVLVRTLLFESAVPDGVATLLRTEGIAARGPLHSALVDAAREALFWSHVVSITTGLLVAILLVVLVLDPLNRVIGVTRQVAAGNFSARVPPSWDDEIGELGTAFNRVTSNLQQMEEARRQMIVDVAHDLRAPLTNIRGTLEAVITGVADPGAAPALLQSLNEEVLRLSRLTESMLSLSLADAAKARMQPKTGDLGRLIDQSVTLFAESFARKGVRIQVEHDHACERVTADFEQLAQVLQNLLDNALRHTAPGGRVRVRVECTQETRRVTVANTGPAIGREHLPHLFERFYRVDRARGSDTGGLGVGLAITKDVIEAHGGAVGAEAAGGENRFWFTLPR